MPFPRDTTLPYSVARLRRSNMRHAAKRDLADRLFPIAFVARNDVITQITYGRPSTNTIPESLRTASS